MGDLLPYCDSPFQYERRRTREVFVGDKGVGGRHPIRLQSMTIRSTHDVLATVDEIAALEAAGCEIVRVTVASAADARALPSIREGMRARGVAVPLVADIHFSPGIALQAVEQVEKVRVNPGNFVDRKRPDVGEISDEEFEAGRMRVEGAFVPLVRRAKARGIAMRIGVNHGSLSDRIVHRFGDSPAGMVESALEFVRVCEKEGYRDLILSMKSSNPIVMIQAYRLLVARMRAERMEYPLHLGVTEAGEGREGRVKSAVGIGALLEDGLGDTIRVSLTEEAVREIPVARALAARYERVAGPAGARDPGVPSSPLPFDPFRYARRRTRRIDVGPVAVGAGEPVRVEAAVGLWKPGGPTLATRLAGLAGGERGPEVVEFAVDDAAGLRDLLETAIPALEDVLGGSPAVSLRLPGSKEAIRSLVGAGLADRLDRVTLPLPSSSTRADRRMLETWVSVAEDFGGAILLETPRFDAPNREGWRDAVLDALGRFLEAGIDRLVLGLRLPSDPPAAAPARFAASFLGPMGLDFPWVLVDPGCGDPILFPSVRLGASLCDGFGDAVRIEGGRPVAAAVDLAHDILQATRVRTSRAEFISCPSCGRTLFDLETTSRRIRELTGHLVGVKIAVMGCLVNGPGEMADADFGYVGWKPGKVNLYVGHECVEEGVPEGEAGERLVALIRRHGRWVDPPARAEAARGA